jgi:hypothetical protein
MGKIRYLFSLASLYPIKGHFLEGTVNYDIFFLAFHLSKIVFKKPLTWDLQMISSGTSMKYTFCFNRELFNYKFLGK